MTRPLGRLLYDATPGLVSLHSPLSGMSSASHHRSESAPSLPWPPLSPCGSPITRQDITRRVKLSMKLRNFNLMQQKALHFLITVQVQNSALLTSMLPSSGQYKYVSTVVLQNVNTSCTPNLHTDKIWCVWPWWPVRSSPSPAPLHGWGQMGGKCGASDWTQHGATPIDWCLSSGRWGMMHCWSPATCQCCSSAWRVTQRERRKER